MSIETQSQFRYGLEIDKESNNLYINDETGSYTVPVPYGAFCASEIIDQINGAFAGVAGLTGYSLTYDPAICKFKIARDSGTFDLLLATGGPTGDGSGSLHSALGFESIDWTSITEVEAENQSGKRFTPQFYLQSFVDCDQNKELRQATKNESSSGDCCEILHCGIDQFFEFEIKAQTNIPQSHRFIRSAMGYDEVRDFLDWAICGKPVEFLPDCEDLDNIYKIKLDRTRTSRDGTGYELTEMIRTLGCGYYRTGILRWRVQEKPEEV